MILSKPLKTFLLGVAVLPLDHAGVQAETTLLVESKAAHVHRRRHLRTRSQTRVAASMDNSPDDSPDTTPSVDSPDSPDDRVLKTGRVVGASMDNSPDDSPDTTPSVDSPDSPDDRVLQV